MILIMAGIAAVVAGYVLAPILRGRSVDVFADEGRVLAEALDAERRELELDLQAGKMTADDYARAIEELEGRGQSGRHA